MIRLGSPQLGWMKQTATRWHFGLGKSALPQVVHFTGPLKLDTVSPQFGITISLGDLPNERLLEESQWLPRVIHTTARPSSFEDTMLIYKGGLAYFKIAGASLSLPLLARRRST